MITRDQEQELVLEAIQLSRTLQEELPCIRAALVQIVATLKRMSDK